LIPEDEKDTSLAKLTIYRVGVDDVGNYRCVGSNGFGFSSVTIAVIGEQHLPSTDEDYNILPSLC